MKSGSLSKGQSSNDEHRDESELCDEYDRLRRRNAVARGVVSASGALSSIGVWSALWAGASPKEALLIVLIGMFFLALGMGIKRESEELKMRPLSGLSDEERSETLRLIRSVPDARRLSEQARKKGRSLRMFDLEAMREFQRKKDAKLLERESYRLGGEPAPARVLS